MITLPSRDQVKAWAKANRRAIKYAVYGAIVVGLVLATNAKQAIKDARVRQATQVCLTHSYRAYEKSSAAQSPADIQEAMRYQAFVARECNIALGREKP